MVLTLTPILSLRTLQHIWTFHDAAAFHTTLPPYAGCKQRYGIAPRAYCGAAAPHLFQQRVDWHGPCRNCTRCIRLPPTPARPYLRTGTWTRDAYLGLPVSKLDVVAAGHTRRFRFHTVRRFAVNFSLTPPSQNVAIRMDVKATVCGHTGCIPRSGCWVGFVRRLLAPDVRQLPRVSPTCLPATLYCLPARHRPYLTRCISDKRAGLS